MTLTPKQIATLDQQVAHVESVLDEILPAIAGMVRVSGPEVAAAQAAALLNRVIADRRKVESLIGVALVRLAQSTQEQTPC